MTGIIKLFQKPRITMPATRIIKRYSNRRLYDTITSRYITLDEIKELVLQQIKFKVVDNKTNEDLTTYVLLQIISEYENKQVPLFTTEILENIIRFYGNPLQKSMSQFLEKFFSQFTEQKNPLHIMTDLTKRNLDFWQAAFSQFNVKTKHKPKRHT